VPSFSAPDVGTNLLAVDPAGEYLFAITQSGITQMTLGGAPLSVGNIQPAWVTAGGVAVTVRGSGFEQGRRRASTALRPPPPFVDSETLTVELPLSWPAALRQ